MLPCWPCLDSEENVGDQEFFDDQQEFANQGKYSMGLTLMSYSPLLITHLHVSNFDTRKEILVFDYHVPCSPMGYMHMGSLLALNVSIHDLHNEIMVVLNKKVKLTFKQPDYRAKEQMTFDHDALGPP